MKTFKQFKTLREEIELQTVHPEGDVDIRDKAMIDNLNVVVKRIAASEYFTPQAALEKLRKWLISYHIHLPRFVFTDAKQGETAFEIQQFGGAIGMDHTGRPTLKPEPSSIFLYFSWEMNTQGMFEIDAEVMTELELEDTLGGQEEDAEDANVSSYRPADQVMGESTEKKNLDVVWSTPSNDGNKFVIAKRDKPAAPAHVKDKAKWDRGQDDFMMYIVDKKGKILNNLGSHPSLQGAKGMAKNRGWINESKSATGYEIYHKDYSSAVQHARKEAEKKGYKVDDDDWDRKVAMGPRKPGNGKTNSFNIDLLDRAGKPVKKQLNMQVYNTGNKYELNMYVEETQIDEIAPLVALAGRAAAGYAARKGAGKVGQKLASVGARATASYAANKMNKKLNTQNATNESEEDYVWIIKGSGRDKNAPQRKVPKSSLDKYTKKGWKLHENQMMRMDELSNEKLMNYRANASKTLGGLARASMVGGKDADVSRKKWEKRSAAVNKVADIIIKKKMNEETVNGWKIEKLGPGWDFAYSVEKGNYGEKFYSKDAAIKFAKANSGPPRNKKKVNEEELDELNLAGVSPSRNVVDKRFGPRKQNVVAKTQQRVNSGAKAHRTLHTPNRAAKANPGAPKKNLGEEQVDEASKMYQGLPPRRIMNGKVGLLSPKSTDYEKQMDQSHDQIYNGAPKIKLKVPAGLKKKMTEAGLLPPINKKTQMGKMTPPKDDKERAARAQAYRDKKSKEVNELSSEKLRDYRNKAYADHTDKTDKANQATVRAMVSKTDDEARKHGETAKKLDKKLANRALGIKRANKRLS